MTTAPILITDRLTLRPLTAQDYPAMVAFNASTRSQYAGGPATAEQVWRFLAVEIGHWVLRGYGRWGIDETATGTFVGMSGLWKPQGWPEPEIGYDLMDEQFEGKGFATEAATAVRNYAYDVLGWDTVISLVHPENTGSQGVAKRLGATKEAPFKHERFGSFDVWRHPSRAALASQGRAR
ncbi:MAG: RimJ/RimL family protein N-acetyltransferase [Paracoccaceae bacterium]|jgi:RimJ/RimL family protein N-acetyltransferase